MPYELLLSTDTLDQGRIKLNNFFNTASAGLFTGTTGLYSIVSTGLENYASGPTSFIVGRKNSGTTYGSILGGTENYTNSSNVFIGNGYKNKIKTSTNVYSSILNGKYNYIYNTIGNGGYNIILGGYGNKISQNYSNAILNGSNHICQGTSNTILNGFNNRIINLQSTGPYNNLLNGSSNYISGNTLVNNNLIVGNANRINNYVGGLGGNAKFNIVNGRFISIYKGSNCTINGNSIKNTNSGGVGRNHIIAFGQGTGSFNTSTLYPDNSYSMVMGSPTGLQTRKVRIEFGGTPGGFILGGGWNSGSADFGEYFEWEDQNINNESRVGYFVSLNEGKIKISDDENCIGIVSKTAGFIGDSNQDYWNESHLKDEWGVDLKQKYQKYSFDIKDEKGKIINNKDVFFDDNNVGFEELPNQNNLNGIFEKILKKEDGTFIEEIEVSIINPKFDPDKKYIPRKDRKEWDVVGLLGKLLVRTSEQITGNYVDVDINTGMAKNGTKYHVMKKTKNFDGNYGIVLIFFK